MYKNGGTNIKESKSMIKINNLPFKTLNGFYKNCILFLKGDRKLKKIGYGMIAMVFLFLGFENERFFAENEEKQLLTVFDEKISMEEIKTLVSAKGGTVLETYGQVAVASIKMPTYAIDEFLAQPEVKSAEEDFVLQLKVQQVDWGVETVKAPAAWNSGFTGKGVKVAVIDSGIAPHEDLKIAGGISTVDYTSSYADDQGHGTHVAGTIAARNNSLGLKGVAYDTELYAVKAFDQNGAARLSDIIEGVDWSISNGMDIVNLSAGTQTESAAFRTVVDRAYANGLLIVAAAGNDGAPDGLDDTVDYPARYSSVIGVGAVDSYSKRAIFSSTGPAVEVAAPGVRVLSTYLRGEYAYLSGTSMAAPHVTGELALLKQAYPDLSNEELRIVMTEKTKDLGAAGRDPYFGYGLIQLSSLTESIKFEEENPVARINLSQASVSGVPGEVVPVTATAVYKNGETENVTVQAAWSSANTSVATVTDGKIKLGSYGKTTVKAIFKGQEAVVVVEVPEIKPQQEPNPVTNLEVNPPTSLIGQPGEILNAIASATYKNGTVQNVTDQAMWTSANPAVATVSKGRVELKGYGSTMITVSFEDYSAMLVVNSPEPQPEPNPVVQLKTSRTTLVGKPGERINVSAIATYENNETQDVTNNARWSSANSSVAAVTNGTVELKSYGKTTLTVTFAGESAVIAISVPEAVDEQGDHRFQDVSSFYDPAVTYLVQNEITQGLTETEFGVSKPIIRADAAIWLARELDLNTATAPASGFTDVPERAAGAVNALKEAGIIGGKTATRFGSSDPLTRGEVAIILQRAYNLSANGRTSSFTDVSSRYQSAVDALVANGVTHGLTSTQFGVSSNITRGQLAVFIYRLSEE